MPAPRPPRPRPPARRLRHNRQRFAARLHQVRGNRALTLWRYAGAMLGKYQNIFRSRWKAVSWALGVMLTAYCTVPSAEEAEAGKPGKVAAHPHKNPWAKDASGAAD